MFDIAKASGVSQTTVSRVLRQNPNVSHATRNQVLESMRKLGYMSNVTSLLYPSQTRTKQFLICLCASKENESSILELPYFQEIISGIREALKEFSAVCRIELLLTGTNTITPHPQDDGIFLVGIPSQELCNNVRKSGVPCVIISDDLYSDTDEMVTVNNYYSCRSCCQKMIAEGIRSFGFLLADLHTEHLDGFLGEMFRNGIPLNKDMIRIMPSTRLEAEYMAILQEWRQKNKMPQVLVTSYGPIANCIQNFLAYHSIHVPEDVRILCFTQYEFSTFQYSVIESHPKQMGVVGAKQMLHKCEHPDSPPLSTVIPNTFQEIFPQTTFSPESVNGKK